MMFNPKTAAVAFETEVESADEMHACIATLQSALDAAHARIREVEALAATQNVRIVDVMRHTDNAESRYRELETRWQIAQRARAAARAGR